MPASKSSLSHGSVLEPTLAARGCTACRPGRSAALLLVLVRPCVLPTCVAVYRPVESPMLRNDEVQQATSDIRPTLVRHRPTSPFHLPRYIGLNTLTLSDIRPTWWFLTSQCHPSDVRPTSVRHLHFSLLTTFELRLFIYLSIKTASEEKNNTSIIGPLYFLYTPVPFRICHHHGH